LSLIAASAHDPNDTQNPTNWVRCITDPTGTIQGWQSTDAYGNTIRYRRGVIRNYMSNNYVAVNPKTTTDTPPGSPDWFTIPTLTNKGVYNADEFNTYDPGDYVQNQIQVFNEYGTRHVEKYGESDLSQLNVPLILV
jgi:chitodextrinase